MRAHRITSAQRGLEIRGLNESAGSGPGAEVSIDFVNKAGLSFFTKYPAYLHRKEYVNVRTVS